MAKLASNGMSIKRIVQDSLDFSVNSKIKSNLDAGARLGYLPISFSDLKTENRQLADLISYQIKNDISLLHTEK